MNEKLQHSSAHVKVLYIVSSKSYEKTWKVICTLNLHVFLETGK